MTEWLGYLEHATPERLLEFTENAGKGGYTIFGELTGLQGLPWCATFVFAVHPNAKRLGRPCSGVVTLARRMILRQRWRKRSYLPKRGDLIFLRNSPSGLIDHCGIVEICDGSTVASIEGNAVDPSGVFRPDQGGAVARRERQRGDPRIVGYANMEARWKLF